MTTSTERRKTPDDLGGIVDGQPQKPKVLVTDDDDNILELIGNIIRSWGYEVVTLKRKMEALEKLEEINPDVVTTDLESPELDGFAFIYSVKGLNPLIPVIVLSGNLDARYDTDGELARKAFRLGAFACLPKPCHTSAIQSAIERALKKRRSHGGNQANPVG